MKKYEIKNMNGAVLSACTHISEVLEQLRNYADVQDEFNYQLEYKGECICYGTAAEIIAWIME